jgi:hypothetical protein
MLSCEVISDLMVAYASGEASAETRRLVEEHLAGCPICYQAFRGNTRVEEALANLEPVEQPANGSGFIARTRRLIFIIGVGSLLIFACLLVTFERVVMENAASIPLPRLPGPVSLWVIVAAVSLLFYVAILVLNQRKDARTQFTDIVSVFMAATLLIVVVVAVFHIMGTGTALSVALAILLLLAALAITFIQLTHLPYMVLTTALAIILTIGLTLSQIAVSVATLGDFSLQWPSTLGHPAGNVSPEEAIRIDLGSLGLDWAESVEVNWIDKVWIGSDGEAVRALYQGDGGQAYLTLAKFNEYQQADAFFVAWNDATSNVRVANFEVNLPGLPGQGRIVRFYAPGTGRTYSAWQNENWVTIVEVSGPFSQASQLAQAIKEVVAGKYGK